MRRQFKMQQLAVKPGDAAKFLLFAKIDGLTAFYGGIGSQG